MRTRPPAHHRAEACEGAGKGKGTKGGGGGGRCKGKQ